MPERDVVERVNKLLVEGFELEEGVLAPAALIHEDLGLDSLDTVDLVVALEREFACRISEEQARAMRSLEDIYRHIRLRVGCQEGRD
ncbi:MAG: acyl carrier protein [Candidatus Brocadiaceae bacterium]|nr:acyl carrier protein [Candidatus Brocadiaceae bacterium]